MNLKQYEEFLKEKFKKRGINRFYFRDSKDVEKLSSLFRWVNRSISLTREEMYKRYFSPFFDIMGIKVLFKEWFVVVIKTYKNGRMVQLHSDDLYAESLFQKYPLTFLFVTYGFNRIFFSEKEKEFSIPFKKLGFTELVYTLAKRDFYEFEINLWEDGVRNIFEISSESLNVDRLVWSISQIPLQVVKTATEKIEKTFFKGSPVRELLPYLKLYCQIETCRIDSFLVKTATQNEGLRKNLLSFLINMFRYCNDKHSRKKIAERVFCFLEKKDLFVNGDRIIRIKKKNVGGTSATV